MSKAVVIASWEDAPHLDPAQREAMLASIPPWQRDARSKGIPQLGSGAIYQVPESDIRVQPVQIPPHWPRGYALDVGWNRTAALFCALDRDTETLYVYDEYYRGQLEPSVHAAAIKSRGDWLSGVIDPAARGRSQNDGEQLLEEYQNLGLDVSIANNAREAGIYAVWERLSQGRLKVFSTCQNFFAEYRLYRRDEKGNVVKKDDHLMDCLRYFILSGIEYMKVKPVDVPGKRWFDWSPPAVWAG